MKTEKRDYSAAICIIVQHDKLLTVNHYQSDKFDLPGGASRFYESPACTAQRETFEETGIRVKALSYVGKLGSGTALFACKQQSQPKWVKAIPLLLWSGMEVDSMALIDPYTLSSNDWRAPRYKEAIEKAYDDVRQLN